MKPNKFKLSAALLIVAALLLLIYSFSQIDLNLTLSSNPVYQFFQSRLISLGYFHRQLSTFIYINIVILLSVGFKLISDLSRQKTFTSKNLWFLVLLLVAILLLSYPAFSHDIFNYLFDSRIVTKYSLSPWIYKPLDFPADEWIRFMRWTHRPSVYPPIWIGISLIPSLLGLGKFTLTLTLFKFLSVLAYLGSIYLLLFLAKKLKHKHPLQIASQFAFNPLVVVETLVNGHMEIVMIFFGLLALKLTVTKHRLFSWIMYLFSVGIKFMTFYLGLVLLKGTKYLKASILIGLVASLGFILWYGFQPWYILWILPFLLLVKKFDPAKELITLLSIAALFWNLPFLLQGDFNLPETNIRILYVIIPFAFLMLSKKLLTSLRFNTSS